jgi:hypothetical protein
MREFHDNRRIFERCPTSIRPPSYGIPHVIEHKSDEIERLLTIYTPEITPFVWLESHCEIPSNEGSRLKILNPEGPLRRNLRHSARFPNVNWALGFLLFWPSVGMQFGIWDARIPLRCLERRSLIAREIGKLWMFWIQDRNKFNKFRPDYFSCDVLNYLKKWSRSRQIKGQGTDLEKSTLTLTFPQVSFENMKTCLRYRGTRALICR